MAKELLVGVTLKFNDTDPDNFAVIERNVPERLRNEGDQCATTIVLPRALCARIAAHFNWVKAKENDPEFQKWLKEEAGIDIFAYSVDDDPADINILTSSEAPDHHEHEVSRMIDEGGPGH